MTREEFAKGWSLLTAQPWGRPYDNAVDQNKAKLQFEFYFSAMSFAHFDAWKICAKRFSAGTKWPSLDEMKHSLTQDNRAQRPALPEPKLSDMDKSFGQMFMRGIMNGLNSGGHLAETMRDEILAWIAVPENAAWAKTQPCDMPGAGSASWLTELTRQAQKWDDRAKAKAPAQ